MQGEVKRFSGLISTSTDPYYNIALENHLLRDPTQENPILLLWQSVPAIVMGRFQNPWLESNMPEAIKHNIKYVRRFSGGGTVYQDLGNLNFCFIEDRKNYDKRKNCELIATAISEFGIKVEVNARYDLIVEDKKISGSAFKEIKEKCLHHGTILINTDLEIIKKILHHEQLKIESKSIKSTRSPVLNLQDLKKTINVKSVLEKLSLTYFKEKLELKLNENFKKDWETYASDDWVFRETPIFELKKDGKTHHVEKGYITKTKNENEIWEMVPPRELKL